MQMIMEMGDIRTKVGSVQILDIVI